MYISLRLTARKLILNWHQLFPPFRKQLRSNFTRNAARYLDHLKAFCLLILRKRLGSDSQDPLLSSSHGLDSLFDRKSHRAGELKRFLNLRFFFEVCLLLKVLRVFSNLVFRMSCQGGITGVFETRPELRNMQNRLLEVRFLSS